MAVERAVVETSAPAHAQRTDMSMPGAHRSALVDKKALASALANRGDTWPADSAHANNRAPSLGRHEQPPKRPNPEREFEHPSLRFLRAISLGPDTAKASVAVTLLAILGRRYGGAIAIKPQNPELWRKIAIGFGITSTGAGALQAQSDFDQFMNAVNAGDDPSAQGFCDTLVADIILATTGGVASFRLGRNPGGKALRTGDPNVIDAPYRIEGERILQPQPGWAALEAPSNVPVTGAAQTAVGVAARLSQFRADMVQALAPGLHALGTLAADERGSIPLSLFGGRNLTTQLITLGQLFRWRPLAFLPVWDGVRLNQLTSTLNRALQTKYPGMPGLELYPVENSSIYTRPFDPRTFEVPVEIDAPLNNLAHRYWGYVCARAEQSWLIAEYMAKVQTRSAHELERLFSPKIVEAVLRDTGPMNPEHAAKAEALANMTNAELEQAARYAGAEAEAKYWSYRGRVWDWDPVPGFDD